MHEPATTPFHDLQACVRLPRLTGLALSPDGSRLVTTVAVLDAAGTRLRPALWEVDPAGRRPARRLTRGVAGESSPVFGTGVSRHRGDPGELPHRFLYFPDENHWILSPQNVVTWYETVIAFLDHHVLGQDREVPEALR